jgi:GNAT superfamily N-acetyltransferase
MSLTIEAVDGPARLREFIQLPRRLYRNMPGYVAPLDMERGELIKPKKSPFFSHGRAVYWIARRNNKAVGRISAQIDDVEGPNTPPALGLFGCFDAIDDAEVTSALLATAEDWLRQQGRRQIRGPFTLSINSETGLLVEGQTKPPMVLLPWHPPYLERHLLAAGYGRAAKLLSFVLNLTKDEEDSANASRDKKNDFTIRTMRLDDFVNEMEIARAIYNDGWQRNWGFVPGTQADAQGLAHSFKPLLLPEAGFFICKNDEPIAFALSIPNIFDITADLGAAPSFLGWLKLLWRIKRRRFRSYRLVFIGGKTAYRGTGIGNIALSETISRLKQAGAEEIACAWVLESNAALIRVLQKFHFSPRMTFGVYEKPLSSF